LLKPLPKVPTSSSDTIFRSVLDLSTSGLKQRDSRAFPPLVTSTYAFRGKFELSNGEIYPYLQASSTARTFDLVWPVWGCYFDISPPRHSPYFQQIHPLSIPACKWLRFIFRLLLFQKPGCHIYNSKARRSRLGRHSYATPLVLAGFSL
jgi:hypothetical protein